MNKVLVIYCHPEAPPSRANGALRQQARAILAKTTLKVTWHDLYQRYPDFHIGVEEEQALLQAHDVVVFQHPLFWYSVPALLKQWLDEVLLEGWAYGSNENGPAKALQGKVWAHWITTGGSASAYKLPYDSSNQAIEANAKHHHFSIAQLLAPVQQSARFCGCTWLEAQVTYASPLLSDEELVVQGQAFAAWLSDLAQMDLSRNGQGASHA